MRVVPAQPQTASLCTDTQRLPRGVSHPRKGQAEPSERRLGRLCLVQMPDVAGVLADGSIAGEAPNASDVQN